MTGEITLRGRVLPVGGIKEKVLAAHRAGLRTVVLPKRNEKDLDDLPDEIRKEMTFIFAEQVSDVWDAALSANKVRGTNGDGYEPEVTEGSEEEPRKEKTPRAARKRSA